MITERERQAREGTLIYCSVRQVQDFLESAFFSDFANWIEHQIITLQLELEQTTSPTEVYRLQGALRAWREALGLPLAIKEAIIEQQENQDGEGN